MLLKLAPGVFELQDWTAPAIAQAVAKPEKSAKGGNNRSEPIHSVATPARATKLPRKP